MAQLMEGLNAHQFDPHALVACEAYGEKVDGAEAVEEEEKQPLSLRVHPDVAFLCDLHAHLCDAEIIGLLGGRWDPETREMHVQAPFPCRAVPRDDDGATDVEMDPVSELQVREVIRGRDLDVVGWYHSHPRFMAEPSVTDIENQRQYQTLFEDDAKDGPAPFVGLIVGTYDQAATGPRSVFRYFHVAPPPDDVRAGDAVLPMALRAQVRSYKRGVTDDIRAKRREGFKEPPPKPPGQDKPFAFLKAGHLLGCACCPPGAKPAPVIAQACAPAPAACAPFPPPAAEPVAAEPAVEPAAAPAPAEPAPAPAAPPSMTSLLPPAPPPAPAAPAPAPVPPAPAPAPQTATLTLKLGGATVNAATIGDMAAAPPPPPPVPAPKPAPPKPKRRPVYAPVYYQPRAPKQRDRSIVGPSLGPRDARGCFPCPAGCPRTFAHAPAAVQHGKSCQNGTRPPGRAPPQKRPAAPRAPRVPRAPQPPRERQFACERDKCVALICEAARDKLDPALRARPDDGSGRRTKAAWEALLAKYDPTPLASCVHTLGQLARYYSTHARRVDLLEGWRQGLTKWEKMMNSMAVWVLKMIVEEGDRADFLADVIGYILICWCDSAAPRRRRGR